MKRVFDGVRSLDRPIVLGGQAGGAGGVVGALRGLTGGIADAAWGAVSSAVGVALIVTFLAYVAAYRFGQMRRDGEERSLVLWFFRCRADGDLSFRFSRRS